MKATSFNGASSYGYAAGAALHLGDGPWTLEMWFRSYGAANGTLYSGGVTDVLVYLDTSFFLHVAKQGTGDHFVSTSPLTVNTNYHLMVTRTGATTAVYINGVAIAGTTTARTFAKAAGNTFVGATSTGGSFWYGDISHVAIYNVALSAAVCLAHATSGLTIAADEFEYESDANGSGTDVYVMGGNDVGSGWVTLKSNSAYRQTFMLDSPLSTTAALKNAIGTAFLKSSAADVVGGRALVVGVDGWRAGQTVYIPNAALGVDAYYEIRQITTTFGAGRGVNTYDISFGALPWSGTFDVKRKKRGGNKLGQPQAA
jgi:hypothetical protein